MASLTFSMTSPVRLVLEGGGQFRTERQILKPSGRVTLSFRSRTALAMDWVSTKKLVCGPCEKKKLY